MSSEPGPGLPPRIRVDRYERASGVPDALRDQGVVVDVVGLEAGDYDVGEGVLVERKSTRDLHDSVLQGRLWRQVASLRRSARVGLVLVEGRDLDAGPLPPAAVRGVLLSLVAQGIVVLRTTDPIDTAAWLRLLAAQAQSLRAPRDRPVYAQVLKRPGGRAAEAMLCAVPGISVVTARALLGRFGSVASLSAATEAELRSVPGVGPVRAAILHRAVNSD